MEQEKVREGFNQVIESASQAGHDTSNLEVAREFFTNPLFKIRLEEYVFVKTHTTSENMMTI